MSSVIFQPQDASFAQLQESFSGCELTDEEIRQECEIVRQEIYARRQARGY